MMDDFEFSFEEMLRTPPVRAAGKRLIMCFSMGRSGTRWLSKMFCSHRNCHGACDRFPEEESFFRYVTWYDLPVDVAGFIELQRKAVNHDWSRGDISFVASPYFAFGIPRIVKALKPTDLIFIMREPDAVACSLYAKGWYRHAPMRVEVAGRAHGTQIDHVGMFHHNFSRILPKDRQSLDKFANASQLARIAWYCSTTALAINDAVGQIHGAHVWVMRLADIDDNYSYYKRMARHFGLEPVLARKQYMELKGSMSNRGKRYVTLRDIPPADSTGYEEAIAPYRELYERTETASFGVDPAGRLRCVLRRRHLALRKCSSRGDGQDGNDCM